MREGRKNSDGRVKNRENCDVAAVFGSDGNCKEYFF